LRIGIDARSLEEEKGTGVKRYLENILKEFIKIAPANDYVLYFQNKEPLIDFLESPCIIKKLVKMPSFFPPKGVLWEQFCLPFELLRNKVDVLFSPSYSMPFFSPVRTVVTIHDITYEVSPEWFHPKERLKMQKTTRIAARRANMIIADSESTRRDIIRYYKVAPEKVKVIYLGHDPNFKSIRSKSDIKHKHGVKKKLVLYVGSIFSRRNIPVLIRSFEKVSRETKNCQLMLIGEDRAYPPFNLNELIESLNLKDKIIRLDYVPEEDLVFLYNAADVFVYPSSYEGFGLPVLEAMTCGTPIVTSNFSSLPEIVADAGLLVDPTNTEELKEALLKILSDKEVAKTLSKRGKERAELFTWKKTAEKTLQVFNVVL
jgi:glycosyltransferase involved in cell wall biosynthesis